MHCMYHIDTLYSRYDIKVVVVTLDDYNQMI